MGVEGVETGMRSVGAVGLGGEGTVPRNCSLLISLIGYCLYRFCYNLALIWWCLIHDVLNLSAT